VIQALRQRIRVIWAVMDEITVQCPYCFETQILELAPDDVGRMVQDCEVCCRPWSLTVSRDAEGNVCVNVDRAQ
jgi:hypothetical protein